MTCVEYPPHSRVTSFFLYPQGVFKGLESSGSGVATIHLISLPWFNPQVTLLGLVKEMSRIDVKGFIEMVDARREAREEEAGGKRNLR
jgi:hypothetical protein